jgi:predicted anti-sigma-YlaC factor YlaD
MNCERANELMMLRLYGETTAAEAVELEAHLTLCVECRRAAEASRAALEEFRREPSPQPSRDAIGAILEAAQPRPRLWEVFGRLRPALWQAAAVVLIALTVSVAVKFWPRQTTSPASTAVTAAASAAVESEAAWESQVGALSERIQLAQANATFDSSLDYRIAGLRDTLARSRGDSDRF